MPITQLQREVCAIIGERIRKNGDSYVAGGIALNLVIDGPRYSRDIDLFHDTAEALEASWLQDMDLLTGKGYDVSIVRQTQTFKEAMVAGSGSKVTIQWLQDSAYRFFPLVEHAELGLTLHPFDLATNKVLTLVGRLEPRDWIDVLECNDKIQPLGYMAWAACGKDPGFNPRLILAEARRSGRYTQDELQEVTVRGSAPDAAVLGAKWHGILSEAEGIVDSLAGRKAGTCVLERRSGQLCRRAAPDLIKAMKDDELFFHRGSIGGAVPVVRSM